MFQELFARIARVLTHEPAEWSSLTKEDSQVQLSDLRAEVDIEAQHTLDRIDDALTAWQQLELRLEREQKGVELWERKAAQAAGEEGKATEKEGAPNPWRDLRAQAEGEVEARKQRVTILSDVMDQARPSVDEALRLVEAIGFSRENALSQIDRLEITQATAEVKERLASAALSGEASRIEMMLRAASERVDEATARASAVEELAGMGVT